MKMLRLLMNGLILLCLIAPPLLAQQRPGSLTGTITDQKTGEGIPFVNIVIKDLAGGIVAGGSTDFEGMYNINPVNPGIYNVEVSVLGYTTFKLEKINIAANAATRKDFRLREASNELEEVTVLYSAPLINKSKSSKVYSFDDGSSAGTPSAPIREPKAIIATVAGATSEASVTLNVRGSRSEGTVYYINGVKMRGTVKIPQASIQTTEVITGGLPAMYGDHPHPFADYNVDFTSPSHIEFRSVTYEAKEVEPIDNDVSARILTAGEINDFSKWNLWEDLSEDELQNHKTHWEISPTQRYTVQLTFENGSPAVNALVILKTKSGKDVWVARTDNTGKAELWLNPFKPETKNEDCEIAISYRGEEYNINKPLPFYKGLNLLEVKGECEIPNAVDISFVVDATGSMGDEIAYLKAELKDVIERVKGTLSHADIRLSSVFYRDRGDEYVTRKSGFSDKIENTLSFIKNQSAGGGGDYPEAVIEALNVAINDLDWRAEAVSRILFLVLDAPPHYDDKKLKEIHDLITKAAEKGIRIIPIASSGIDKSTEYLLRSMALATNGTYTFLTDDSGVGNPHIEPSTDSYTVELLNDLMVRLIHQFSFVPNCKPIDHKVADKDSTNLNTSTNDFTKNEKEREEDDMGWDVYPNPSNGEIQVDLRKKVDVLYLTDLHGKIVSKWEMDFSRKAVLDLSGLPSGTYFFRFMWHDRWFNEQIILAH